MAPKTFEVGDVVDYNRTMTERAEKRVNASCRAGFTFESEIGPGPFRLTKVCVDPDPRLGLQVSLHDLSSDRPVCGCNSNRPRLFSATYFQLRHDESR